MSQKNKKSLINNFLWYCSGLNIRELSSLNPSKSNYFGIGGVNIFSSIFILLLSTWSFNLAFPKMPYYICWVFGITICFLVLTINRQTINSLSNSENQRQSLTLYPILLFSLFIGSVISTPIKFLLFDISINSPILQNISELERISDANISTKITSWALTVIVVLIISLPTLIKFFTVQSAFQKKRSSLINEFMWFCSGANKEILRKCPNEYSKYFGMGGTILFTALMATLSGGYAFYKAFDSASLAICFGFFWGAMIFNLDRFIVNTMYSDGKPTISWKEFFSGLPRIIIAIFLGIVISYPLELKLFEDEIETRIELLKVENLKSYNTTSTIAFSEIGSNKIENNENQKKIEDFKQETNNAKLKWERVKQIPRQGLKPDGMGGQITYTYYIWPPQYNTFKKDYDEIKGANDLEIARLRQKIADIDNIIINKQNEKRGYDDLNSKKIMAINDLSTRMEAFDKLKDEKRSIQIASIFIMLLLVIIEIAPVLFKMMLTTGEYESLQLTDSNLVKADEIVRISQKNDWVNTEITKLVEENKKIIDEKQFELATELASNQELLSTIAKAQSEIAKVAIKKWKEQEMKRAIEYPESFIQSNKSVTPMV